MEKTFRLIHLRREWDMISIPLNKSDLDNLGTERPGRFGELED